MLEGEYSLGSAFKFNKMEYHVIIPQSASGLWYALKTRDQLKAYKEKHASENDCQKVSKLIAEQEHYIDSYIETVCSFDNSFLVNNIAYLVKMQNLKLGELEELLGISAGYISRTAKENSGKRMSVDVVWKLARLFDVDIDKLLCCNLNELKGNAAVLVRFVEKMIRRTESGILQWEDCGGEYEMPDQDLIDNGMVSWEEERTVYHPRHMNQRMTWIVNTDIMRAPNFGDNGEDLIIVPYCRGDEEDKYQTQYYDFLFVWHDYKDGKSRGTVWDKLFYANDDLSGNLERAAHKLYKVVREYLMDPKLESEAREFIDRYLEEK